MGIGIGIATLGLLVLCWMMGDREFSTKLILTFVYLGSCLLYLVHPLLCLVVQGILDSYLWYSTFGVRGR
jgi:hypothetical protein